MSNKVENAVKENAEQKCDEKVKVTTKVKGFFESKAGSIAKKVLAGVALVGAGALGGKILSDHNAKKNGTPIVETQVEYYTSVAEDAPTEDTNF